MKGTVLKEKTSLAAAGEWLRHAAATSLGRAALSVGLCGVSALLLAAPGLLGRPLPFAACLPLCAGLWAPAAAALLGACGGYAIFWGWELAMEPLALSLSCFAGALIFRRTPVSRSALAASLCAAVGGLFLLDTGFGLLPAARLLLGTGLAALTPRLPELRRLLLPAAAPGQPGGAAALPLPPQKGVERALHSMYAVLAREDPVIPPVRLAEVYDFAAEQVCRCCVRHAQCWEQNAEDTYRDLCAAGEAIILRGAALREDLPPRFTERCCHTAGFLTAVNQAMDEQLSRRRAAHRRSQGCRVAAGQYLAMERLLAALARPRPAGAACYAPELAVGSSCRNGNTVSGDRGAVCTDRFGCFYVLLCDGMGAGPAARAESDRAARLLTAFLKTGLEADTALSLMNGFFVLRRDAVFATLDLLKLDLRSGAGTLYKWGAAPSYLRRGGTIEKIGTATPPPGLDAGESRVPGQYELSLGEGETLVMVSDGAFGEQTEQRLRAFAQGTVRDLASCLITLGEADAEDDRTAVVIRLRELKNENEA